MGAQDVFPFGRFLFIGLIWYSVCVSIRAQSIPGFLSIDCGAAPYNDAVTKFSWEGDSKYTSTGMSGRVPFPVNSTLDNSEALKTFRYFPDRRSKHCYELPTTGSNSFLLRSMFLHGSAPELTLPIVFDVAVNGTVWFRVTYSIDDTFDQLTAPLTREGVIFSPGSLTHFCLVAQTGVPFISSLEIRDLDPDGIMYRFNGSTGLILQTVWRFNCGAQLGSPTLRYPDDPFDRLWKPPGEWASNLHSLTGTVETSTNANVNNVPPKVMQDAWLNDTTNSSISLRFPFNNTVGQVYIAVYFEEIEANATAGDRFFEVNMNGNIGFHIARTYPVMESYWDANVPNHQASLTFTGLGSGKGPIVNAVELYAQHQFNDSATAAQDVDALASLQVSFNLTDWQGDPCCPVPWDWVSCTEDVPARVNELLLSNMSIKAAIPPSLSTLTALTEIHLDNNSLYGTIPDSLAFLPLLTFLYLNDNDLTGDIPMDLLKKLGTNFYYSGNSLSPPSSLNSTTTTKKKKSTTVGIIAGIAGGAIGLGLFLVILICYLCSRKKKPQQINGEKVEVTIPARQTASKPPSLLQQVKPQPTEVGQVSYETVKAATNNFNEKIGQGSYGSVYRGLLHDREVAVKINNIQSDQGHSEFMNEVEILTRVHHRNLVSLIGYCNEGEKLILIYEFQVNGTLREWLHDEGKNRGTIDWKRRIQIAADGAKGLEYLHKGCDPTIIHRDVKSSNILLDSSMTAKVADFGLSKSTPGENTTGYSTLVKGTPGYLDPEYHHLGRLTHKSDVYSYGVVIAEILAGLPPFKLQTGGSPIYLLERVRNLVERNDIQALADPNLQGKFNPESMWRMAEIALSCTDPVVVRRPDFTQVVNGINEAIELEKAFTLHSPVASSSSSYGLRSNSNNRYQTLP